MPRQRNLTHHEPGMRQPERGGQVITAKFDWKARENHKTSSERTMYLPSDENQVWTVRKGEFVFIMKSKLQTSRGHIANALTQLNGRGAEELQLYPTDEGQQTRSLSNIIQVIGVADDDLFDTKSSTTSDFLVKVSGVRNVLARGPIRFGDYIRAVPPKPSQVGLNKNIQGVVNSKITLIPEPYQPDTISETIRSYIRMYLNSNQRMNSLNDMRFRRDPMNVAIKTLFAHNLFIVCIGLYKFLKLGIVTWNNTATAPAAFQLVTPGQNPTTEDIIIAMMQNFDLYRGNGFTPVGTDTGSEKKSVYTGLSVDLLSMIHWDGRVANDGFGFDANAQPQLEGKSRSGDIINTSPRGATLNLQLNLGKASHTAMSQFITNEYSTLQGRSIGAAEDGQWFGML